MQGSARDRRTSITFLHLYSHDEFKYQLVQLVVLCSYRVALLHVESRCKRQRLFSLKNGVDELV